MVSDILRLDLSLDQLLGRRIQFTEKVHHSQPATLAGNTWNYGLAFDHSPSGQFVPHKGLSNPQAPTHFTATQHQEVHPNAPPDAWDLRKIGMHWVCLVNDAMMHWLSWSNLNVLQVDPSHERPGWDLKLYSVGSYTLLFLSVSFVVWNSAISHERYKKCLPLELPLRIPSHQPKPPTKL